MLNFSLAAALFAAAMAGLVLWRAARPGAASAEAPEAAVYARQLAEIDDQRARGLLDESGWRAARAESGRRLLGAAGPKAGDDSGGASDRAIVLAVAVAAVVLGGLLYLAVGKPGRPDEPYAARLAQWSRHPESLDPERLAAVLESALQTHPNDPVLLSYLGQAYAGSGQYVQAAAAFEKLTRIRRDDVKAWAALGEVRMAAADGRIGPDTRAAFEQALKLDPRSPAALWWLGRDDVQAGRREQGLERWRTLLAGLSADDPRRAEIEQAMAEVQSGRFGQVQAVAEAPPQAQSQMIRAMVDGLAKRLEHERGQPSDWERLVRAYAVLGETAKRDKALARARALFGDRPQDLQQIVAAAQAPQAGP
jgi:cytochrome c-type biogenesis protein CcmH